MHCKGNDVNYKINIFISTSEIYKVSKDPVLIMTSLEDICGYISNKCSRNEITANYPSKIKLPTITKNITGIIFNLAGNVDKIAIEYYINKEKNTSDYSVNKNIIKHYLNLEDSEWFNSITIDPDLQGGGFYFDF